MGEFGYIFGFIIFGVLCTAIALIIFAVEFIRKKKHRL